MIKRLLEVLRLTAASDDWLVWEAEDALDARKKKPSREEATSLLNRLRDNCNWVPRVWRW